jgi:hypothetical protein
LKPETENFRYKEILMSLTDEIKRYALDLGYSRIGITTAEPIRIEDVPAPNLNHFPVIPATIPSLFS